MGVISAYLYDAIGDMKSIRRMASFYAKYSQAIPYDIALLGGLHGQRSEFPTISGLVGLRERPSPHSAGLVRYTPEPAAARWTGWILVEKPPRTRSVPI